MPKNKKYQVWHLHLLNNKQLNNIKYEITLSLIVKYENDFRYYLWRFYTLLYAQMTFKQLQVTIHNTDTTPPIFNLGNHKKNIGKIQKTLQAS